MFFVGGENQQVKHGNCALRSITAPTNHLAELSSEPVTQELDRIRRLVVGHR